MDRKVLFTASTYSHIANFHLPYLRKFREEGWTVHVACGGDPMPIPDVERVINLPFEKTMWSLNNLKAAILLSDEMRREGYELVCTHYGAWKNAPLWSTWSTATCLMMGLPGLNGICCWGQSGGWQRIRTWCSP